jgi:hypothetical protein
MKIAQKPFSAFHLFFKFDNKSNIAVGSYIFVYLYIYEYICLNTYIKLHDAQYRICEFVSNVNQSNGNSFVCLTQMEYQKFN